MTIHRKPLDAGAGGLMVVLCLIWGLAQVNLKMAAADISPLMLIALRSGVAAVLVVLLMFIRREGLSIQDGTWRPGLLVAGLFTLEFFLIGEGLRYTSASHMTVLLYTAPIFAALGLHLLMPSERLSRAQWFGIGLAFTGVAIAFLFRPNHTQQNIDAADLLYGDLLSLGAGIAWAATTVGCALLKARAGLGSTNAAVSARWCFFSPDYCGIFTRKNRYSIHCARMGQSDFSISYCLLRKLPRLVLAAQTLQRIRAGGVFFSHTNFWGSTRSRPARGATGNQFYHWRGLCHRRNYLGERFRMVKASNHAKMMRSITPELLYQTKLPI
jgi:uncharacterized membrane protein